MTDDDVRRAAVDALGEAQARLWGEPNPAPDRTPVEAGGAVLIVTLSPAEVAYLAALGAPDLITGVHLVLDMMRDE